MKTYISTLALILFVAISNGQSADTYDIVIYIENLKSNNGKIFAALYNDEGSFLKENYQAKISEITDKKSKVTFSGIPNGIYAVSFYQDENDNQKLDTNFMGIPKEPYGCSNNARGFMGPPKWEDAKFYLKDKTVEQTISL